MNQQDFFKFLKSNNLYNVYEIGKYTTKNFSFGNAVSLIGKNYKGIQNAYELLRQTPNKIRINCNVANLQQTYTIASGTSTTPNRGIIGEFEENPILINTEDYFLTQFSYHIAGTSTILSDMDFALSITTYNIPNGATLSTSNTIITYDNDYADTIYYIDYFEISGYRSKIPQTAILIDRCIWRSDKGNQAYQIATNYNPSNKAYLEILLFGDKKKQIIHSAMFNTYNNTLFKGSTIPFSRWDSPKIKANIAFVNESRLTSDAECQLNFNANFNPNPIQDWLKTISI